MNYTVKAIKRKIDVIQKFMINWFKFFMSTKCLILDSVAFALFSFSAALFI